MPYAIKQFCKIVETHASLEAAERAFWVLTAHELKNGRTANLELNTYSSDCVSDPEKYRASFAPWVVDVLVQHELLEKE